jgi:hypothetical protein
MSHYPYHGTRYYCKPGVDNSNRAQMNRGSDYFESLDAVDEWVQVASSYPVINDTFVTNDECTSE